MRRLISSLLIAGSLVSIANIQAEEVTLQHNGLTLNANLNLSEENGYERIVLITHGTLAHNGMEIIDSWQALLADEEISSLAINLSLGIDNRHGMYDCPTLHKHKHTDAADEIASWVNWLVNKGSESVILAAHSRGGNQTAWYSDQAPNAAIKAQILLAPQTWSVNGEALHYQERYKEPLQPLLDKALTLDAESTLEKTDFIYCEDTSVTAESFISYYKPDQRFDTPTLLKQATIPTLVIAGSEDTTVPGLATKMSTVANPQVTSIEIEGADHFFRDLYMDEVIEHSIEFIEQL